MKISVIMPVYNAEKYLNKCLDSIINQTIGFNNIELIIINDGSTDNSEKIIKSYQDKYKNIKYIYQQNCGQATSRNVGLSKASSEYVTFVDSDDYIDKNMFKKLYNEAIKYKLDIVTCDLAKIRNDKIFEIKSRLSNDEIKNYILTKTGPCNMLIIRSFLNENKFSFPDNLRKYEDIAVIPILGLKENVKIKHIDECLYFYYDNDDSVMNNKKYTKKMNDIFKSMDMLLKSSIKEKKYELYKEEIEYLFIRHFIMSAGLRYIRFNDPENKIKEIKKYMDKNFKDWKKNKYLKDSSIKYKVTAHLVYHNRKKIIHIMDKVMGK